MQKQSGDGEQEGFSEWFQTSFGLVFWVPPALGDEKRKRKVGRERERERDRERKRERERERGRWKMETNRRRERERETERGRGRGERERCKWWAAGCFRVVSDLFLSVGYLSFGEKTGKERREGRKRGETKQAPKTYSNCSHCGPERPAAVRKSKHPKRTLIVAIVVRKDLQRSGKASTQNVL